MIFLAASEPCTLRVYEAEFTLQPLTYPEVNPNHILVMETELGRRILQTEKRKLHPIRFEAEKLPGFPKPLPPDCRVDPASRVVIIRGGGIGDVLMCTPAIRELRKRFSADVHLSLATFRMNRAVFAGNPDIDEVIAEPMTLGELMEADYCFEFRDSGNQVSEMNMTDFYLQGLGIDPTDVPDKRPILSPGCQQHRDVLDSLRQAGEGYRKMVYLNGLASDRLRDLSLETLSVFPPRFPDVLFIFPTLYDDRYRRKGYSSPALRFPNVLPFDSGGSIGGYVTAIACCDAVVSTDSSAYHIAAALGKPCIALFGPISSALRTNYYPSVVALDAAYRGKTCTSPCGKSMLSEFASEKADREGRCPEAILKGLWFSPCLSSFSEEELLATLEGMLGQSPGCAGREPLSPGCRLPRGSTQTDEWRRSGSRG